MRLYIFLILMLGSPLVMISCISNKPTDPLHYQGRMIVVGSGGGFAGEERQYRMLDNGQLYVGNPSDSSFVFMHAKSKRRAAKWLTAFDSMGVIQLDFNHPGNTYQYLETGDGGKRVVWGSKSEKPEVTITDFYKQFMAYWVYSRQKDHSN